MGIEDAERGSAVDHLTLGVTRSVTSGDMQDHGDMQHTRNRHKTIYFSPVLPWLRNNCEDMYFRTVEC